MATTLTHGEWHVTLGEARRTDDKGRSFPANLWVVDQHGTHVATVINKPHATLIAAAPAMLEALRAVLEFAEDPEDPCVECGEMRQYYGHNEKERGRYGGFNTGGQIVGHEFMAHSTPLTDAVAVANAAIAAATE